MEKNKLHLIIILMFLFSICTAQNKEIGISNIKSHKLSNIKKKDGSDISPNISGNIVHSTKAVWDVLYNNNLHGVSEAGIETDGNFIYTANWKSNIFYKYDFNGALLDSFVIASVSGIRDMAYDGTYFYGGANSSTIYKMNFTNHTLVDSIVCPVGTTVRNISYDPVLGGFWVGGWNTDITCINPTGAVLSTILASDHGLTSIYGSAYDGWSAGGPYLWLFEQTSGGSSFFKQISLTNLQPTGIYHVCTDITDGNAGGAFCYNDSGIITLGGLIQGAKYFAYSITPDAKDAGISSITTPSNYTSCLLTTTESIKVTIKNYGNDTIYNINVSYIINSANSVTHTINDTILPGDTLNYTFPNSVDLSSNGTYMIKVYTSLTGDNNHVNDTLVKTVTSVDASSLVVNIQTDNYGSETTWSLISTTTGEIIKAGGPYNDNITGGGGQLITEVICAPSNDCYNFTIYDIYGDGIENGFYEIKWNGFSLGTHTGNFADSAQLNSICQPQANDVGIVSIDLSNSIQDSITPKGTIKNYGTNTIQNISATIEINPGGYTSTRQISTLASGEIIQVSFNPKWVPTQGTYTVKFYTSLTGGDSNLLNDTITKDVINLPITKKAFCYVAFDGTGTIQEGPAYFDLDNPSIFVKIANQTGQNFLLGCTWINGKWYGIENITNNLITIDTLTGARTIIGKVDTTMAGGLTYDYHTNTLFGVSLTGLFSINTATAVQTFIGNFGIPGSMMINLACEPVTGQLYGMDLMNNNFCAINKSTGLATVVGNTGDNATYRDMEFDQNSICYLTSNDGNGGELLRTANVATGATTQIGTFPSTNITISGFAIPGDYTNGLSENNNNITLNVFPNPVKDVVNVSCSNEIKRIKVLNSLGQVVLDREVNNSFVSINKFNLESGLYFLQIETKLGAVLKKIIVQK